jgi:hypothetical protein
VCEMNITSSSCSAFVALMVWLAKWWGMGHGVLGLAAVSFRSGTVESGYKPQILREQMS